VRGLEPLRSDYSSAGVVRQVHGASDHHPVWAVVRPAGDTQEERGAARTGTRPKAPKSP
jgi:hypothetical protein